MAGGRRRVATVVATGLMLVAACGRGGDDDAGDGAADEAVPPNDSDDTAVGARTSSDGCDSDSAAPAADERVTLQSGGEERWYLRHLPPSYDGAEAVPLVVDFHGYSEGAEVHVMNSELSAFGDEHGFVTLTPQGRGEVPRWEPTPDGVDVAFVGDLLDEAAATLCVDPTRFYATGLSNGAMMTSVVACVFADRIAAAAPVAGVADVGTCEPTRPVPVVSFHGTDDPFIDYEGGFGPAVANLPAPDGRGTLGDLDEQEADDLDDTGGVDGQSVPEVMAGWAGRNGCHDDAPAETEVADDVTILSYGCPEGAEVELYRIEGGGHTWPGSPLLDGVELVGPTTFSISANEVMWEFFEDHPLA
ncbi:MAG: alpha/beta hydrolase family esterase [Acidimicrobiales bacterium]